MSPHPERDEIVRPTPHALEAFVTAVSRVTDAPDFIVAALTDRLASMEPIAKRPTLVAAQRLEAVKGGLITAEEVVALVDLLLLTSLDISELLRWTVELTRTRSMRETAVLLRWTDVEVAQAVEDRRLFAVEIDVLWRFPDWQFTYDTPDRLLPGLQELASVLDAEQWELADAFMRTPQEAFSAKVARSPRDWLLTGGDVGAVLDAISTTDHDAGAQQ